MAKRAAEVVEEFRLQRCVDGAWTPYGSPCGGS